MKVLIVTQEEPFYIPLLLSKVLTKYKTVIAVVILPGMSKGFVTFKRLYDVFGLRDFVIYGTLFIHHRLLNLLSRWRWFGRFCSVSTVAKRNSIPVYKLKNINALESLNFLKALEPEIIISVAAPQIFKRKLINLARHVINIHAALLPKYRGMMPCFWVLAKGEEKTGVTVHYLNEHVDDGNIILQNTIDISPQDTLHSLQSKVANVGAAVLLESLQRIERGNLDGIVRQGDGSYYSFPTKEATKEFRSRGRRFI